MGPVFLLLAAVLAQGAPFWHEGFSQALAQAKSKSQPVLVDFEAPWCYSCYYMRKHVLDRPGFAALSERLVLLRTDVDTEAGEALKKKYAVTFLPTYVLLDADGKVLGRVVGEQTEADFLAALKALLESSAPGPEGLAVRTLKARLDAGELERARAFVAAIPAGLEKTLNERKDWRVLTARLSLRQGREAEKAFAALLKEEDSCALAYDFFEAAKRLQAQRLSAARGPLQKLVDERVFSADHSCADFRSPIEALAKADPAGAKALFARAVAFLDAKKLKPGEDRNHDDNLRYFLQKAGEDARVKALYPKLVEAYPADYVYAQRFAKYLLEQGDAAGALPWIERSAKLAYGANRLAVTEVHANILIALGRMGEAKKLLERDIKAGKAFPASRDRLRSVLAGL